MEEELFSCEMCIYHVEGGGCKRPLEARCYWNYPLKNVPDFYKKFKSRQLTLDVFSSS